MNGIPNSKLTLTELVLLRLLQRRKGQLVSYKHIEHTMAAGRAYAGVLIREIRRKRQDVLIQCVQGKGYKYICGNEEEKKPVGMYRRGTLDMPKCSVKGCPNHLYWSGERLARICFHHRNLQKRRNAPKNAPTIRRASYAQG